MSNQKRKTYIPSQAISSKSRVHKRKKTNKKENLNERREWILKVIHFILLTMSTAVLVYTFVATNLPIARVKLIHPTDLILVRGLHYSFPSDNLIITTNWENSGNTSAQIHDITLTIDDTDTFTMYGAYYYTPDRYSEYEDFYYTSSIIIPRDTVTEEYILFHHAEFNEKDSTAFKYQFKGNQDYSIQLQYYINDDDEPKSVHFTMPLNSYFDSLIPRIDAEENNKDEENEYKNWHEPVSLK